MPSLFLRKLVEASSPSLSSTCAATVFSERRTPVAMSIIPRYLKSELLGYHWFWDISTSSLGASLTSVEGVMRPSSMAGA